MNLFVQSTSQDDSRSQIETVLGQLDAQQLDKLAGMLKSGTLLSKE